MAINVLGGGMAVAKYSEVPGDGERYNVRLKAREGEVIRPADLSRLYVRAANGELIRFDNIARLNSGVGPPTIARYDLQYAANFFATPAEAEGDAAQKLHKVVDEMTSPLGYQVRLKGRAEGFGKTAGYMVLVSQFNAFSQPLIIRVAQPLAIIGGVFGLWLMNHSLNITSMIGLVLLICLVAKNSILLVDPTNQRRDQGRGINEALLEACPIRMRRW